MRQLFIKPREVCFLRKNFELKNTLNNEMLSAKSFKITETAEKITQKFKLPKHSQTLRCALN